jgi:DNA repair exonuclease SbcCD ATPase subunit
MSQPSSSAPAFKSDVRVKMLQTELSVLQQKLRDMESENRQTMQRLQRTLELSWKKDLKSIHEVLQRRQENSLSVSCVDESPNAKVPASSIVASGCSNDFVNGQIQNLAQQIHSLKERMDQHVTRPSEWSTNEGESRSCTAQPDQSPQQLELLRDHIEAAVRLALEKQAAQPASAPQETNKATVLQLERVEREMAGQANEVSQLKRQLEIAIGQHQQSQLRSSTQTRNNNEQDAALLELEATANTELSAVRSELNELRQSLEETTLHVKSATQIEKALDVQQCVTILERDLIAQLDDKLSSHQSAMYTRIEQETRRQVHAHASDARIRSIDASGFSNANLGQSLESLQKELKDVKQDHARLAQSFNSFSAEQAKANERDYVARRNELEERMTQFWVNAAKLEEHLAEQFANQEQQLHRVRSSPTNLDGNLEERRDGAKVNKNDELDQRIETWDEQLADLIQFVEQTVQDQTTANHGMQSTVESVQGQQVMLQQKLEAVSNTWDKKLKQLTHWIQQPVAEEHKAHESLRNQMKAEFSRELTEWKLAVDSVNSAAHQRMAMLGSVQDAQEAVGASLERAQAQFQTEMAQLLAQGRGFVAQFMSMNTAMSLGQGEHERTEQGRREQIATWQTQLAELMDQVQRLREETESARQRAEQAVVDRHDARAMYETLQQQHETTTDQLEAVTQQSRQYQNECRRLRGQQRTTTATLEKRKGQLRTLLLTDVVHDSNVHNGGCDDGIELVFQVGGNGGTAKSSGRGGAGATSSSSGEEEFDSASDNSAEHGRQEMRDASDDLQ